MPDASSWTRGRPLRLDRVEVTRGRNSILRGVDLSFEPGHRHVLIGASGSGKSTLLRLLNRLDDPSGGVISLGDISLKDIPARVVRRSVGLVFQTPRPLPGTVAENLLYPFSFRGKQVPAASKLAEALEEVGLDPGWLDRDAANLSGGERQRLAIATALGADPEILALDEPTSALDPASAHRVASALARRSDSSGLRTIVVTHSREMAEKFGDRGNRLEGGRVVDSGPIGEVLARADASTWLATEEAAR